HAAADPNLALNDDNRLLLTPPPRSVPSGMKLIVTSCADGHRLPEVVCGTTRVSRPSRRGRNRSARGFALCVRVFLSDRPKNPMLAPFRSKTSGWRVAAGSHATHRGPAAVSRHSRASARVRFRRRVSVTRPHPLRSEAQAGTVQRTAGSRDCCQRLRAGTIAGKLDFAFNGRT